MLLYVSSVYNKTFENPTEKVHNIRKGGAGCICLELNEQPQDEEYEQAEHEQVVDVQVRSVLR